MSDPKEALERLNEVLAMLDLYHKTGLTIQGRKLYPADLSWLIAEREGLERALAYKEERRVYWQYEAGRLYEQSEARWKVQNDLFGKVTELSAALDEANSCLWIVRPESVDAESYARISAARDHNNGRRALLHPTVPVETRDFEFAAADNNHKADCTTSGGAG